MSKQFVEEADKKCEKRHKFGRISRKDQDEIQAVKLQKVFQSTVSRCLKHYLEQKK